MTTWKASAELDAADPLNQLRLQFVLPTDKIYLDGNSLGPLSRNIARPFGLGEVRQKMISQCEAFLADIG